MVDTAYFLSASLDHRFDWLGAREKLEGKKDKVTKEFVGGILRDPKFILIPSPEPDFGKALSILLRTNGSPGESCLRCHDSRSPLAVVYGVDEFLADYLRALHSNEAYWQRLRTDVRVLQVIGAKILATERMQRARAAREGRKVVMSRAHTESLFRIAGSPYDAAALAAETLWLWRAEFAMRLIKAARAAKESGKAPGEPALEIVEPSGPRPEDLAPPSEPVPESIGGPAS